MSDRIHSYGIDYARGGDAIMFKVSLKHGNGLRDVVLCVSPDDIMRLANALRGAVNADERGHLFYHFERGQGRCADCPSDDDPVHWSDKGRGACGNALTRTGHDGYSVRGQRLVGQGSGYEKKPEDLVTCAGCRAWLVANPKKAASGR